jgi:peptidoglycan hydrolase-like protein with peptidoglycan-binding domain
VSVLVFGFAPAYGQAPQDELRAAQQALQARGYDVGPIDGIMGPLTRSALEAFQRKSAVPVTGTADEPTLRALGLQKAPAQTAGPPTPAPPTSGQPSRGTVKPPLPSTPQAPTRPAAASGATSQSQVGDNGGLILFLVVVGIAFFVWRRGRAARLAAEKPAAAPSQNGDFKTTVTVSSRSIASSYGANRYYSPTPPTPEALQRQSSQTWIKAGKAASVPGFTMPDGMVYLGAELVRQNGRGPDNCLINPKLPVADPRGTVPEMPYYPCYSEVSPEARGYYLRWLASGKREPSVGTGYVFLYFYGLERRLMLDRASDEYVALVSEVKRLHQLYGKNYSVNRYAQQLLEAARLVNPNHKFYEDETPGTRRDYELPLSVRLGVGQLLSEGKTIPWNWMFAWAVN